MIRSHVYTGIAFILLSVGLLASISLFQEPAFTLWAVVAVILLFGGVSLIGIGLTSPTFPFPKPESPKRIVRIGKRKFIDLAQEAKGEFVVDMNDYRWLFLYINIREGYEVVLSYQEGVELLNILGSVTFNIENAKAEYTNWEKVGRAKFFFCNWDGAIHPDNEGSILIEARGERIKMTIPTDPRSERDDWSIVLGLKDANKLKELLSEAWEYPGFLEMDDKVFVGYVGDWDIHDGTVTQVERDDDRLYVVVSGGWTGSFIVIEFKGVESVESNEPIGMVLDSLSEMKASPPLRQFIFTNWYEPDELEGKAYLRVLAKDFEVTQKSKKTTRR